MNNKRVEYTRVGSLINSRVVVGKIWRDWRGWEYRSSRRANSLRQRQRQRKNTSDIGGGGNTKGEEQDGSTGASVQSSNISEIEEIHREASEEQTVSGQCQIKPR